jgi:itaconyl-CoA hydratase
MDKLPAMYKKVDTNRYREIYGMYYEDFTVGDVIEHRPGRTILDVDNTYFTLLTLNSAMAHFDWNYSSKTEWERPLLNSTFTLALVTGMSVHSTTQNGVANLGWDNVKLLHPIFIGDTVYAETEIKFKRDSKSRPTQGIVTVHTTGLKVDGQTGEKDIKVIEFDRTFLMQKREFAEKDDTGY